MSNPEVIVSIFDTTLRDGAQALPQDNQFPDGSKSEIADYIARFGAETIEAGFPATPFDAGEVRRVAETVGRTDYAVSSWVDGDETAVVYRPPVITGLSRVKESDIDETWGAVSPAWRAGIHTFVSTDPAHMAAKFPDKTPDQLHGMAASAVAYAKSLTAEHPDAIVEFSAEAASTTDMDYLERIVKTAVDNGADVINIPDTVGQRDPFWMQDFYTNVIDWVVTSNPDAVISAHNHNDLGNAVVNTFALVRAAARYAAQHGITVRTQAETTIAGIGERAGNANIFPFAASMFKFSPDMPVPVRWNINPGRAVETAGAVMSFAGIEIDRQMPVVGQDTNVHRSGIHSDGVVKGGFQIYSAFDPRFWGHDEAARHEDGKYQGARGRTAIQAAMAAH